MESKKAEDLIVKESDFLGFQKIKQIKPLKTTKSNQNE